MQLLRLLLLLLAACITLSYAIAAADDRATLVVSKTREKPTTAHQDDGETSNFGGEEDEERGVSFLSKIKGVFGVKKAGLGTNVAGLRKDPGVIKALEKNPTVKRLGDPNFLTRLESNPKLVKQLSNNPELRRAGGALEKAGVKITMNDVKSVVVRDPAKVAKLDKYAKVFGLGVATVATGGLLALMVYLLIDAIRSFK